MTARSACLLPLSIGLMLALTSCSASPQVAAPRQAGSSLTARATTPASVEGPLTARRVLGVTHGMAERVDAHAAFTALLGTHIEGEGLPGDEGEWQAHYQGTEPSQSLLRRPGALPLFRHIVITVNPKGHVRIEIEEQPGMPLGQAFFERPMPELDSRAAIVHARRMRPTHPLTGEYQLTLTGMMNAAHFQELVWKVQIPQSSHFSAPVVFNASTGEPVKR